MNNKHFWISIFIFGFIFFVGCNNTEEKKELLPATKEVFYYKVAENASILTVDEEGLLYTVSHISLNEEKQKDNRTHIFEVYDLEGNCIEHEILNFGTGTISVMTIMDGKLYTVATDNLENYVYIIDTATWQMEKNIKLTGYRYVDNIILLGEYLYILGKMEEEGTKDYILHPDVFVYNYQGETICRMKLTDNVPKMERMKVDFPISMYVTERNTLMIYQYTEESAFGFYEFDPENVTMVEHEWKHGHSAKNNLSGCEKGFIYTAGDVLRYGTVDGTEAQIIPDKLFYLESPVYQKGFLFYSDRNCPGVISRLCIQEQVKNNKEIRMLVDQFSNDEPYGCGFQMTSQKVVPEEFALKVLAQDRDYDVYLLSSREEYAYNLKKNGAYYTLNEVEGVQEYLDACFPYIKELAYNENGDIWMVPVAVAIPGLIYSKDFCEENKIDYSQMDYLEFLVFLEKSESENPKLTSMSYVVMVEELFMQYLSKYDTFDTDLLRMYLIKLRDIYEKHGDWGGNDVYGRNLVDKTPAQFYLEYSVYSSHFDTIAKAVESEDYYGIAGTPKVADGIGNMGTITFLAVNPQSDNLKDTLSYITEFCNYMMSKKNSFMLADEKMYLDTPFIKEQYQLYKKGEIDFRIEYDIFLTDFNDYLAGGIDLEKAISEAERKRKIYLGE